MTLNHYLRCFSYVFLVLVDLDLTLPRHQYLQPPGFFLIGDRILELQSGSIRPWRVLESEHAVVADLLEQVQGLLEVCLGLAGEAHDHVRGNADFPRGGFHPADTFEILLARVEPLHRIEHAIRSALHRQVDVIAECRRGIDRLDNVPDKISRVRGCEPYAP